MFEEETKDFVKSENFLLSNSFLKSITCSITEEPMKDPYSTSCLHTFEKEAIYKWFEANEDCPTCRRKQKRSDLKPNYNLKGVIDQYNENVNNQVQKRGDIETGEVFNKIKTNAKTIGYIIFWLPFNCVIAFICFVGWYCLTIFLAFTKGLLYGIYKERVEVEVEREYTDPLLIFIQLINDTAVLFFIKYMAIMKRLISYFSDQKEEEEEVEEKEHRGPLLQYIQGIDDTAAFFYFIKKLGLLGYWLDYYLGILIDAFICFLGWYCFTIILAFTKGLFHKIYEEGEVEVERERFTDPLAQFIQGINDTAIFFFIKYTAIIKEEEKEEEECKGSMLQYIQGIDDNAAFFFFIKRLGLLGYWLDYYLGILIFFLIWIPMIPFAIFWDCIKKC